VHAKSPHEKSTRRYVHPSGSGDSDSNPAYRGVLKTRSACPDFGQILVRFWSDLGQIFGQVFDEGFGQVFWSRKYSVQFYSDREIQFYRVRRKRREKPSFLKPSLF